MYMFQHTASIAFLIQTKETYRHHHLEHFTNLMGKTIDEHNYSEQCQSLHVRLNTNIQI